MPSLAYEFSPGDDIYVVIDGSRVEAGTVLVFEFDITVETTRAKYLIKLNDSGEGTVNVPASDVYSNVESALEAAQSFITPTGTPTVTPTPIPSVTQSVTPSVTPSTGTSPTPTPTSSVTATPTVTPTITPTITPTPVAPSSSTVYGTGASSTGDNNVAIGYNADVDHDHSIVLGANGQSSRVGEISNNINSDPANEFFRGEVGFVANTTTTGPTEIFAAGESNERFDIKTNSLVTFKAKVSGYDTVTYNTCHFIFEGAIKRDATNNTTFPAPLVDSILVNEGGLFLVTVTADDINEALTINVTAPTTNLTKWVANVVYEEIAF